MRFLNVKRYFNDLIEVIKKILLNYELLNAKCYEDDPPIFRLKIGLQSLTLLGHFSVPIPPPV